MCLHAPLGTSPTPAEQVVNWAARMLEMVQRFVREEDAEVTRLRRELCAAVLALVTETDWPTLSEFYEQRRPTLPLPRLPECLERVSAAAAELERMQASLSQSR